MDEDDEYKALRQVLEERCPGAKFRDDDVKRLVDAGYDTEISLGVATKDSLDKILPTRPGVVGLLMSYFAHSTAGGMEGGGGHPLSQFVQLRGGHPLSKFVTCLQDVTLQQRITSATANSVIELPEGIVWLGNDSIFSNQLFLRPCYFELLEAKKDYFKLNSKLRAVVYTGTPGIGKSHLCALVIAQKLIAGTVVFFEHYSTSAGNTEERMFYRLDLRSGVHRYTSSQVLDFVSGEEDVVYIVDGRSPSFPFAQVEVQIFASPSKLIFRPAKKGWAHYLYLHTPLFDLNEIYSCKSAISAFEKVSQEDVEEWYSAAGGVARTSPTELLGCTPDIACYSKLLTGGLVPLAATLATQPIFEAFRGISKSDALLHGTHIQPMLLAVQAQLCLQHFSDPSKNSNLLRDGRRLRELWSPELVSIISSHPSVVRVVSIGTIFALELRASGPEAGYASMLWKGLVEGLRHEGIYSRPLGSVVYLMCGPLTEPKTCTTMLQKLLALLG